MPCTVRMLLLLVVAAAAPLYAQDAGAPAELNSRVRVRQAGAKAWSVGNLARMHQDSLFLNSDSGEVAIARGDVSRMDVSRGVRGRVGKGFRTGAMVGAGFGLVAAIAWTAEQNADSNKATGAIVLNTLFCGVVGGLIGIPIGALARSERWARVDPREPSIVLIVDPDSERTMLGLSVAF